jgi:hypothetical protein
MAEHLVIPEMSEYHIRIYEAIREYFWWGGAGDERLQKAGQLKNEKNTEIGLGPSQYELQIACRCSSTTVRQALAELRKRGLIEHPKFSARSMKPTDISRTISKEPLDPWAILDEDEGPRYWKTE